MKWCVALCVFHDISQIFHDNGFLLVVLLACFFLCVFRLRFCLRFCLCFCLRVLEDNRDNGDNFLIMNSMLSEDNNKYNFYQPEGWLPLESCWWVFCLRFLEDNRDNGDNGLILNSMLSEDNNKYKFYQPKGWLPLENCWRGFFDGQGWLAWLARLTILACKIDYFGV